MQSSAWVRVLAVGALGLISLGLLAADREEFIGKWERSYRENKVRVKETMTVDRKGNVKLVVDKASGRDRTMTGKWKEQKGKLQVSLERKGDKDLDVRFKLSRDGEALIFDEFNTGFWGKDPEDFRRLYEKEDYRERFIDRWERPITVNGRRTLHELILKRDSTATMTLVDRQGEDVWTGNWKVEDDRATVTLRQSGLSKKSEKFTFKLVGRQDMETTKWDEKEWGKRPLRFTRDHVWHD